MSSRRFACDRCRIQKIRCIREDQQSQCSKCTHADSPCVTTKPVSKFRNLTCSADTFHKDQKKSKRPPLDLQDRQPHRNQGDGSPSWSMYSLPERSLTNVTAEELNATIENLPLDFSHHPFLSNYARSDPEEVHLIDSVGSVMDFHEEDISYLGSDALVDAQWDVDIIVNQLGGSLDETTCTVVSQSQFAYGTRPSWDLSPLGDCARLQSSSAVDSGSLRTLLLSSENNFTDDMFEDIKQPGCPAIQLDTPCVLEQDNLSSSSSDRSMSHTHRLASLNLEITALLEFMRNFDQPVTIYNFISPASHTGLKSTTPLEDVLDKTRRLLDVVNSLSKSKQHLHASQPSTCSNSPRNVSSNTSNSLVPSNASPPTPPVRGQLSRPEDYTVALHVITCYINVVRLYIIIFSHIITFIKIAPSGNDGPSILLTGIRFEGSEISKYLIRWRFIPADLIHDLQPLPVSRHLHVATLVKAVKGLFREVEDLMGLPPRLGVCSDRDATEGFLGDGDLLRTAEAIVQAESSHTGLIEIGQGGTAGLRTCIRIVHDLLL